MYKLIFDLWASLEISTVSQIEVLKLNIEILSCS